MASIHGLLLVRKPKGITSHDVVSRVRRRLSIKEVGHAGTLDPLAEGLMVLLLGEATKMSSYVLDRDKQYEVSLRLGIETDTLDVTGHVIRECPVLTNEVDCVNKALALQGEFLWEVPVFSATKVNGRKLYEAARSGDFVADIPRKPMKFWGIEYLGKTEEQHFSFRLDCSKGSFIRTWVAHLGQSLGCGAVMTNLVRTHSAPYLLDQAIDIDQIEVASIQKQAGFIPLLAALPSFKTVRVSGHSEGMIRNGQISHELRRNLIAVFNPELDQGVKVLSRRPDELLALIGLEKDRGFVVRRVFRY